MTEHVLESTVRKGRLELTDLPFDDDQEVRVVIIPKLELDMNSFERAQKLTSTIKGNLSDDVVAERSER